MTRAALTVLALPILLLACSKAPPPAEPMVGPFSLKGRDAPAERMVCIQRETECVQDVLPGPSLVAIGFDQRHLVLVRKAPEGGDEQYYYVVRHPDEQSALGAENVHGPMTAEAFAAEQVRLRLPSVSQRF